MYVTEISLRSVLMFFNNTNTYFPCQVCSVMKAYLRQVKGWLPCGGKMKRQIMEKIRISVGRFLEEEPGADYQSIVARFGTPQQIASAYVDEQDTTVLLSQLRFRKKVITLLSAMALAALALWTGFQVHVTISDYHSANGYSVIDMTVHDQQ